jgi:hypothetical protein
MPPSIGDPDASLSGERPKRIRGEQRLICITAAPRTGTTALERALASESVMNFGEVFHTHPLEDAPGTFLRFAEDNDIRLSETTTRSGTAAIAERYLDWLRQQAAPRHVLIDVKLNSWSVLSHWWRYPHHEPFFLDHLKRNGAAFVFIWREDLGDQVLSRFIARELGIWHNLTAEKVANRTLRAPVELLKKVAELIASAEADMLDHLRDYPAKIVIRYEDLFENGSLTERFRNALKRIAGLDLPPGICPVAQNSAGKRDIIENYDEVVTAMHSLTEERRVQMEARITN